MDFIMNLCATLNLVEYIEKFYICLSSLCTSYGYLCHRLRNTNVFWQMGIQGLGSNWSTKETKQGGNKKTDIFPYF